MAGMTYHASDFPENHPNWKRPLPFGVVTSAGRRDVNQDCYATKASRDGAYKLFAVYDGHGGVTASTYCKNRMHEVAFSALTSQPSKKDYGAALVKAYNDCNNEFCRMNLAPPTKGKPSVGTCAVAALIAENVVHIANAGDSRAIITNTNGRVDALSVDHKPTLSSEVDRIKSAGAAVEQTHRGPRVNGELAVTRSIGDPGFKPAVISEPTLTYMKVDSGVYFLVLASHGVWEALSNERVSAVVLSCKSPQEAAEKILREAHKAGSKDNMTALLVDLRPLASSSGSSARNKSSTPSSSSRSMSTSSLSSRSVLSGSSPSVGSSSTRSTSNLHRPPSASSSSVPTSHKLSPTRPSSTGSSRAQSSSSASMSDEQRLASLSSAPWGSFASTSRPSTSSGAHGSGSSRDALRHSSSNVQTVTPAMSSQRGIPGVNSGVTRRAQAATSIAPRRTTTTSGTGTSVSSRSSSSNKQAFHPLYGFYNVNGGTSSKPSTAVSSRTRQPSTAVGVISSSSSASATASKPISTSSKPQASSSGGSGTVKRSTSSSSAPLYGSSSLYGGSIGSPYMGGMSGMSSMGPSMGGLPYGSSIAGSSINMGGMPYGGNMGGMYGGSVGGFGGGFASGGSGFGFF